MKKISKFQEWVGNTYRQNTGSIFKKEEGDENSTTSD